MVRYKETIEQSAEYLRLAIPLMSRQAVPFHPVSYCLWYEYVAGINPPLRAAIDEFIGRGQTLTNASAEELFRTYVAERDQRVAHHVATGFKKVMDDVSQDAASAGASAHRFGTTLARWTEEQEAASAVPSAEIDTLLSGTREMQEAITTLQARLDASQKEIEKLQQDVTRAREEALADELTGLMNRRGFEMTLASCLGDEASEGHGTCLLFADIDHFKRVNDTYGHLMGDKVLRAVAQILRANVKGKDTAARFGGEEFVVLLPDTRIDGALSVAEKIRSTIEGCRIRRTDTQQEMAQVTVSFGVASYCPGESAETFLARGDAALYAAKCKGRNCVTLATAS
ncbi:diguanylate cyclase [Propionivibrio dicarboxylicus]|uniref:diguanylate cyclase n=1 Tax=Propionivibrio dicarboxylicus TaxID=83767 RepID=A0A1G7YFL3_9RHOO|nr:diguanylate cyclase [Propionivibrio dicarboxylicus]